MPVACLDVFFVLYRESTPDLYFGAVRIWCTPARTGAGTRKTDPCDQILGSHIIEPDHLSLEVYFFN